jgi:antitoxin CcdA
MRAKLNLTIDRDTAEEARTLGVNMSRVSEAAIAAANKAERNRRWVEANRAALEAYAAQIEAEGPALARFRQF